MNKTIFMIQYFRMQTMVSVVLSFDEDVGGWAAWLQDIPAYGQGETPQLAIDDLKNALALYIETVGKREFMTQLAPPSQSLSLPLSDLVPAS